MNFNPIKISLLKPNHPSSPIGVSRLILVFCCVFLLSGSVAAVERPFKGRITGEFVNSPTPDPTIFIGSAQANGKGTHLGAFSKVTNDLINVATG
jgi:hypothetical protein